MTTTNPDSSDNSLTDDSDYSSGSEESEDTSESGSDYSSTEGGSTTGSLSTSRIGQAPREFEEELDTTESEGFRDLIAAYDIDFNTSPIGSGAFSVVRLGKTRTTPIELVAVKVVPIAFAKDVKKEAQTMKDLKHPYILLLKIHYLI